MRRIILVILTAFIITACGTMNLTGKVKKVEIGMTKHEVVNILGNSFNAKGGVLTPEGAIETISYYDSIYGTTYIFNFLDGKLVEWFEERLPPQNDNGEHRHP